MFAPSKTSVVRTSGPIALFCYLLDLSKDMGPRYVIAMATDEESEAKGRKGNERERERRLKEEALVERANLTIRGERINVVPQSVYAATVAARPSPSIDSKSDRRGIESKRLVGVIDGDVDDDADEVEGSTLDVTSPEAEPYFVDSDVDIDKDAKES